MKSASQDLRECHRHPIQGKAEVRLGNGVVVEGEAQDISLHGLMFHSERRLPVGKSVQIVLITDCEDVEAQRIKAGGVVARLHDEGVAVSITDMDADGQRYLCDNVLHETLPAHF